HARRRARADRLRRAATADRDRPGDRRGPADSGVGRRHLLGGRLDRAGDQAGAARGAGRPHHVRDRPPPLDDRAGRSDRGAGRRRDRCAGRPRGAARALGALSRDRGEGNARAGVHDPQAAGGGGGWAMSRLADVRRRLRATGGRGRKLRGLIELLAPYRWRVLAMFVSLVAATGAALAPAPLAKLAIDDGIRRHDVGVLNLIVVGFLVSAAVYAVASYAQTYLVGWVGQRALQDLRVRLFA